jgi:hypothetical protein
MEKTPTQTLDTIQHATLYPPDFEFRARNALNLGAE